MAHAKNTSLTQINQPQDQLEEVLLYKEDEFEIVELFDLNLKMELMRRYKNAYSGTLKNISDMNLYSNSVRFIVGKVKGDIAGFIRINDKTHHFRDASNKSIWNVTDGFTDRNYRGMGILRKLIQYGILNLQVKMIYMEKTRLMQFKNYYVELGFTRYIHSTDGFMIWGFLEMMQV